MPEKSIRVVAVDDSSTWRRIISQLVADEPAMEMAGTAGDGVQGVALIAQARPDVVTLDVEMPRMTGHEVLEELRRLGIRPKVIMLSSLTGRGARATLQALALGAVDFVCKPTGGSPDESRRILRDELIPKIKALAAAPRAAARTPREGPVARPRCSVGQAATSSDSSGTLARPATSATPDTSAFPAAPARPVTVDPARPTAGAAPAPSTAAVSTAGPFEAVVIGVSTGGPDALARLIPRLPGDFPRPILIVQHMPPEFTRILADDLHRRSALEVLEGEAGMEIIPGRVIIAPGGHHMTVTPSPRPLQVAIDDDPPIEGCRPAVEKLFLSAAERWGRRTVAVMLTGMGHDGQAGCTRLHELGAPIICQSPESCVVFGMPRRPVERGQAAAVLALEDIPAEIVRRVGGSAVRDRAA